MKAVDLSSIDTANVVSTFEHYVMRTYNRLPVVFVRGEGVKLWDAEGKEYLDFLAGIAVNGLGHAHPALVDAIGRQAGELMHVSNLYHIANQGELARRLVELSGLGKAFFCNSGAEANEAAIKLARKWAKQNHGPEKFEIITAEQSFHGRTLCAVTATGQPKYHQGFEPLMPGFRYVPYNDLNALQAAVSDGTCAVMLEPIQGESGVHPAGAEYMQSVRSLCDEHGALLVLDEVQTGLGRTGKWFGHEHYGIKPDIMTLAKTLGGGFPIGACLATDRVAAAFEPGSHASTFGGNPLACAAALATLDVMDQDGLIDNAATIGGYFRKTLQDMKDRRDDIVEIRGKGLMLGMELDRDDAPAIGACCLRKGLIVNAIGKSVIRFLPPLIVEQQHVDSAVRVVEEALSETTGKT